MPQDFSGKDLRGHSFKDQDLTGANFNHADIHGTNFTNANLRGADFKGAKAGLQRRWAIGLTVASWLLSGLSGIFSLFITAMLMFLLTSSVDSTSISSSENENFIVGVVSLVALAIFFIVTVRKGLAAGLGVFAFAFAFAFTIAFSFAFARNSAGARAGAGAFAVAVAVAVAGPVAGAVAGPFAVAFAFAVAGAGAVAGAVAGAGTVVGPGAFAVAFALLGTYIGWRGMAGDEKHAWVRPFAIAFAATGGTSFRDADLTDADFTNATLKSTDFRKANLKRTCWHQAKMLDRVRPGETYLQDTKLRQLIVTGQGQGKNFDGLNLRELNLSGANLANVSFIGTDFYQSSLKEADLTGSLLVRTHFESTDLTGATLTGACIEDWVVTRTTKLYDVKCKYVFMKFSGTGDKRDQIPPKGEFKNDDFILFVQSVLDTIKLYHEHDVNPHLALYVLQSLSEDYQCTLEVVKIEKRGESGAIIEVKIPGSLNQEKLKETYYEKYNQYLKFHMTDPKNELKSPTNIENVTVHKGNLIAGSVINSRVTYTIDTEGDTIMPEGSKQQFNNDLHHAQLAGGLVNADTVSAHQIGGNINNYTPQQRQNLAEAAREIQQLLQQLEQTNPTTTTSEKMTVVAKAVDEIEKNSTLKARVIGALKSGGKETLKEAIDHPLVNILMASIEGWQEA